MVARVAIAVGAFIAAGAASAEPLAPDAARSFIAGKLFAFNCFDGTRGSGRIYSDGSAAGSIQIKGSGALRHMALPPGTLRVKGNSYCASLRGLPFEPCFRVDRRDDTAFRGSLAGLGFAYCDFTRTGPRPTAVRAAWRLRSSPPVSLEPTQDSEPGLLKGLRPSTSVLQEPAVASEPAQQ
jgi:hypothetical protein